MTLLTVENVLTSANEIYDQVDGDQREAMRSLIDLYYLKVQNYLSGKILFSESEAICPNCSGVRLLKREYEDTGATSTLNKDFKCPVCKCWYASSEVYSASPKRSLEPVKVYDQSTVPEVFLPLMESYKYLTLVPHNVSIDLIQGEEYRILHDGTVGQMKEDFISTDIIVPDLADHILILSR